MSYEPTVWSEGDFITADKLNKMEQGIKNEQVGPQGAAGAGLTGTATKITTLSTETPTDMKNKINEVITALIARGVLKA